MNAKDDRVPGKQPYYQVQKCMENVFSITEGFVHMYLIQGSTHALLIDTGIGGGNLKALAAQLYGKPLIVANTHGHEDHVGANPQFECIHANPADWGGIMRFTGESSAHFVPISEGDTLDLGNRQLDVLELPGHTPGSVAFWDRQHRILFSGDYVSDRPVYLCYDGASLTEYAASLNRIAAMEPVVDILFGGHGTQQQDMAQVRNLLTCVEAVLAGTLTGIPTKAVNGETYMLYARNGASIFVNH